MVAQPEDSGDAVFEGECRGCGRPMKRPLPLPGARDKKEAHVRCSVCETINTLQKEVV